MDFHEADFKGEVIATEQSFQKKTYFTYAQFEKVTHFDHCIFKNIAEFTESKFLSKGNQFYSTEFRGEAIFINTQFSQESQESQESLGYLHTYLSPFSRIKYARSNNT